MEHFTRVDQQRTAKLKPADLRQADRGRRLLLAGHSLSASDLDPLALVGWTLITILVP